MHGGLGDSALGRDLSEAVALARPSPLAWQSGGMFCLLAGAGYVLTRSVPVPGDPGDVGNWLEPLDVAALITEGTVVILAALVLASQRRRPRTVMG